MGDYSLSTSVNLPFQRALRETRDALAEEELVIITEIDLKEELSTKLGQQIRPYTILEVWVPFWQYQALQKEPDIALLMPSHVCLWENSEGTCTIATPHLKHLCHADDHTGLGKATRAVNARLRAVVASVQFAGVLAAPKTS